MVVPFLENLDLGMWADTFIINSSGQGGKKLEPSEL